MLSNEKKIELTEIILQSKVFQKSPKSSALLRYLVKATIEGTFLKEDVIDFEFFGEKSNFDRNNPRVRVNMYNLRKKIDKYYQTEGKHSHWKLIIEKGQYHVHFENQTKNNTYFKKKYFLKAIPHIGLLIVSTCFLLKLYVKNYPEIWSDFFTNKKETTLIIGDVFGIAGKTITGSGGWTRSYNINNIHQYLELISKKPELEKTTSPSDYSYSSSMGVIASHCLTNLFTKYEKSFDIRFSSSISVEDIKRTNIIYAGPLKNENTFISLFNDSNSNFKITGNKITYIDPVSQKNKFFWLDIGNRGNKDLAIVSKFSGPLNNEVFLFFSNHDLGVKATVEKFTNLDSLKIFNKKHNIGNQNFTAVFVAEGKERTNLKLETLKVIPF